MAEKERFQSFRWSFDNGDAAHGFWYYEGAIERDRTFRHWNEFEIKIKLKMYWQIWNLCVVLYCMLGINKWSRRTSQLVLAVTLLRSALTDTSSFSNKRVSTYLRRLIAVGETGTWLQVEPFLLQVGPFLLEIGVWSWLPGSRWSCCDHMAGVLYDRATGCWQRQSPIELKTGKFFLFESNFLVFMCVFLLFLDD